MSVADSKYIPVPGHLERYREVHERITSEDRPVVWGRYSSGSTAASRVSKLTRHPNNDEFNLRFAQRAFADDVYILAYLTDEQAEKMNVSMTYDMWRDFHSYPDDLAG